MAENNDIFVTRSSMPEYEEFIEAIKPLWESHWLTNMGKYHKELEAKLEKYLEVPQVSLMVNGHMALEMAIQAFGFQRGSEIITTPYTFISTTHAIVRNGLEPIFCDVKEEDGTIDESKIENLITEKTVAILPVHVYGNICNVKAIKEIADKYRLKVIYDAAHAFGEKYDGIGVGNFGDASIFSFHATKVFNTIEGECVTSSSEELDSKLYNLKNFEIRGEELVVDVGANAKMNEICAIMGLCNLKNIDRAFESRKKVVEYYDRKFADIIGVRSILQRKASVLNYAYYPIIVEDDFKYTRNEIYNRLAERGVHVRKYFYPLTAEQACFKNKYRGIEIDIARNLANRVLTLPIYEGMRQEDMDRVIEGFI